MLGDIIDYIRKDLNAYLAKRQGMASGREFVLLSTILNPDGSLSIKEKNVILMTTVDIRENAKAFSYRSSMNGSRQIDPDPLHLNLFVLFSAYFPDDRVKEALNFLTHVLGYFQSHSGLDHQNSPGLPKTVKKLTYELITQEFHEKNHMWGLLGSKYMPSVLYKIQLLTIDERCAEEQPLITEVDS